MWLLAAPRRDAKLVQGEQGLVPLEIRWLHDPEADEGFVGATLASNIVRFHRSNGRFRAEPVIEVENEELEGWHEEIDGYWLLGFVGALELDALPGLDRLRLQLNVDNLLDETFINSVTGSTSSLPEFGVIGGLSAATALDRYFIGYPRTVTLSVTAAF